MRHWYAHLTPFNQRLVQLMVLVLMGAVPAYAIGLLALLTPSSYSPGHAPQGALPQATQTIDEVLIVTATNTISAPAPAHVPAQVQSLPTVTGPALPGEPAQPARTQPPVAAATETPPFRAPQATPFNMSRQLTEGRGLLQKTADDNRTDEGWSEGQNQLREVEKKLVEAAEKRAAGKPEEARHKVNEARHKVNELTLKIQERMRQGELDAAQGRHLLGQLQD